MFTMVRPNKAGNLLLGISGGIAAYKSAELTRLLLGSGIGVQVVMTQAACEFITPVALQALSGRPVYCDLWDPRIANNMAHIELSRSCDAILIAPASADLIAKLAHGLADDLLSTLCLARNCPLLLAPAMNRQMWDNPATARNVAQLTSDGVHFLGPEAGDQACGEIGFGRMMEPEALLRAVQGFLMPKALDRRKVLITAGPTFEAIDAVRGVTNSSSGKMGYAVAQAALDAGADVTLVSGPTGLTPPAAARLVKVVSAAEMFSAVKGEVDKADIFISVAAVADYTPAQPAAGKLKKTLHRMVIEMLPTEDILKYVAALPKRPFCVGFAAESENLHEQAEAKRRRKNLPLMVGNLVQRSLGRDESEIVLFDDAGAHPLAPAAKTVLARQLIDHIANLYRAQTASLPVTAKQVRVKA
jgi:phosphopantothenoylcysteine decarboxylase / phosphopantothenate---cysteine ligase